MLCALALCAAGTSPSAPHGSGLLFALASQCTLAAARDAASRGAAGWAWRAAGSWVGSSSAFPASRALSRSVLRVLSRCRCSTLASSAASTAGAGLVAATNALRVPSSSPSSVQDVHAEV